MLDTPLWSEARLKRTLIVSLAVPVLALFMLVAPAWAGNLDNVIRSEYPNRILTLRHVYSGERLHLYGDGTLVEDAPPGSWTTDSQLEVRDANLNGSVMTIRGRRIYEVYDSKSRDFVDALGLVPTFPEKWQKDIEKTLRKRQVEIQIEMPPTPDPKETSETLHAVFLAPGEPATGIAPAFYREFYATGGGGSKRGELPAGVVRLTSVGSKAGDIKAPHATSSPDPEYSDEARVIKYGGTEIISLIIDTSGSVRDPQIIVPLGAGLDDKAIQTVSHWKFDPATKDGQPVAVEISVEVAFHIQ
jgi:TonB family protein